MKLEGEWLAEPALRRVLAALAADGHRALIVGGAVRNAVMGLAPGDVDLATSARPTEVMRLAAAARLKSVPTGLAHGTVTVIAQGRPFEVTTFRRDIIGHGRHATISFADDVIEDAGRRDFTMNALYAEADGTVIDPLGGLADAQAGRVRFIHDPETRIREDFLRILRFFRFIAWYGRGDIDPAGFAACSRLASHLSILSRERIGAEMLKLLAAPEPAAALGAFSASDGLAQILPGADADAVARLVAHEADARALLGCSGLRPAGGALTITPDPLRRLAALGGDGAAERLRLSRADAKRVALIRRLAQESTPAAEMAWRHGAATALDVALVRAALSSVPLPRGLARDITSGADARFPVAARDLQPALHARALGAALATLERRWIDSGFRLDRAALLATLDGEQGSRD